MTEDEAHELVQYIRADLSQRPVLWFVAIVGVTDNGGDSRDPCRWSVHLINVRVPDESIFVRSLAHWQTEILTPLLALAAED